MVSLLGLDPDTYQPSALNHAGRLFPEANCYVDLWIELLNAHGIDPASAMASACAVNFEGDQWTFFKPLPEELLCLFGIDVHEMQLYRPVADHAIEQLMAGRTLLIEVDSFYLPDTAATTYRRAHVKSSIAIEAIDAANQCLRYFHGPGYYELSGEDYCGLLRLGRKFSEDVLPPYVELINFEAGLRLEGTELRHAARGFARRALARRPKRNPWRTFRDGLSRDLASLLTGTGDYYHAYAFATVRQCGAAFELAKSFVEWLAAPGCTHAKTAVESFDRQAAGAKTLLFKLARRRQFDATPEIEQLAKDWDTAMRALDCVVSGHPGPEYS
jgi:hypothetical protein